MRSTLRVLMASTSVSLVLTQPLTAYAQTNDPATLLKAVVITQESSQSANENKTAIKGDRLRQDQTSKLDDIIRSIAGVFTRQNAQQAGVAVNVRGFEGSGRVNMSIDGVRQNFRFTGHEAAGFTYVDQNLLGGIDITRGATTTIGGGALAGSVNFRTLDVDDVLSADQKYGGLTRLSWGSNGVGFSEMLVGATRWSAGDVTAAISNRNSNNYEDGNGNEVANTGQDLTSGLFKTNLGIREDQTLSLGGVIYNNKFTANSYDQTVKNRTLTAKYHYDPGTPLIDLRVNAYYNNLDMDYTGGSGSYVGRNINDRGVGFDISNTSQLDAGQLSIKSINGLEYFHDKVTSDDGGVNPGNGKSTLFGLFTENQFTYGLVELTTGLRYNYYSLKGAGTLNDSYGDYDIDISKGSFDPKATLAINATSWLQPYVTWSRSMRAPTLQETMLGGTHPGTTSGYYIPNASLEPEAQQGWEFGVNVNKQGIITATDKLTARLNYYVMNVDNYIVALYNSTYRGYQFVNVDGTSKVQGFEMEANYDTGYAFGGISYTHSKSDLPTQLPGLGASQYLPDDIVSLSLGTRVLDQKLTIGSRYSYVSGGKVAGYSGVTTNDETYQIVDLFANYKFNEKIDLNLKVSNLLNEEYTPFLSTTGSGQGRTIYIATQMRF